MKTLKKTLCLILAVLMLAAVLAACAGKNDAETTKASETNKAPETTKATEASQPTEPEQPDSPEPVNTKTCTYEEMVAYLTAKGYIAENAEPVNINETEGYITDNTGGEIPFVAVADKAEDYDGLWLFWWEDGSELYNNVYVNMAANAGTIVFMGGAAVISTEAQSGYFAIAFGEGYAKKDAVLTDFKALPNK